MNWTVRILSSLVAVLITLGTSGVGFAQEHAEESAAQEEHGTEGHDEHAEAHGPWSVPWNDMIEALINFTIFAGALYYFGRKPVRAYLEKRSRSVAQDLEEAAVIRRKAQEKLDEYSARLERFDEERQKVLDNYRRDAQKQATQIIEDAKQAAVRIQRDAQVLMQYEMERAQTELRERVVSEALELARRTIQEKLKADPTSRDRLVDSYTNALADLKKSARS